jgi:hypothetical protein
LQNDWNPMSMRDRQSLSQPLADGGNQRSQGVCPRIGSFH